MKTSLANGFLVENGSLGLYLKEISRYKPLPAQEEFETAERIQKGDKQALEKLVKANLRFVVSVARTYDHQGMSLADLIHEGNLGLIKAAKRFDQTKNFKFISYAVWWIRQAILQALAEQSRITKLPLNCVGTIHKIGKAQSRLEQKYRRAPHIEEIARELDMDSNKVKEALSIGNNHTSLDAPLQNSDSSRLMDLLPNKKEAMPDDCIEDISLQESINKALKKLSDREKKVIRLYFGIEDGISHTLEEIAQRYSLTRERVRQIKENALKKLKASEEVEHLQNHY
ncbi:MAG: sigma-70 family RNA polymerase sigma factor [Chitinivibrionales bacterium]|nr:sigma-70 family RNA polymerase sigma factor [Chitinivibrionales bacterium]